MPPKGFRWTVSPDKIIKDVQKKVEDDLEAKLTLCGEMLRAEIIRRISIGGPPRSLPGEYPHADTGKLRQSINWSLGRDGSKFVLSIGSKLIYSGFLEWGTVKMEPRPFVERTIRDMLPAMEAITGWRLEFIAAEGEPTA